MKFVLNAGFERTIPSYPRYTVMGSDDLGEHHLKIENATLDDDAEYQCQVGPAKASKPIRADAQLNVLSKSRWWIIDETALKTRPSCDPF